MRGDRKRILLLVMVGLVIVSGIIVIPSLNSLSFTWGVDEGDVYVYHVTLVTQFPEYWDRLPAFSTFNNSLISVSISHLPPIGLILNGDNFIMNIVNQNKITCTLENGTEIDDEIFDLISKSILPIGGWNLIDSYFPNNTESYQEMFYDTFFSELSADYLLFGYRKLIGDDTSISWSGYVNLETGMPVNVTQRYFELSYLEDIFLTLVNP